MMKKNMKSILCSVLAAALLTSGTVCAFADTTEPAFEGTVVNMVEPKYSETTSVELSLAARGTTLSCSADVYGKPGTDKITGKMYLQEVSPSGSKKTVKTWGPTTIEGSEFSLSKIYTGKKGYTYILKFNGTVYRNGNSENVSSSTQKTI